MTAYELVQNKVEFTDAEGVRRRVTRIKDSEWVMAAKIGSKGRPKMVKVQTVNLLVGSDALPEIVQE